ncbi:MAG: aldolase superfamily protein [Hyphomicrobiales bacterium]|nr:aldolase superfamily protein [Hyphomicrobiales bacterium]
MANASLSKRQAILDAVPSAKPVIREMTQAEWDLRVNHAAALRMGYHLNWNRSINNHITVRLPGGEGRFLMNPRGSGWDEATASSLVTTDYDGATHSHSGVRLAPAGFNFHSGILKARPDLNCVIHVHPIEAVVLSATMGGLKIVDQPGCYIYDEWGEHDFEGFAQEADEVPRILRDLGDDKHLLMMWNHGLLSVGRSIAEAFFYMLKFVEACRLYERVLATGDEVRTLPKEVLEFTRSQIAAKRASPDFGLEEWNYFLRTAERLYPDLAT